MRSEIMLPDPGTSTRARASISQRYGITSSETNGGAQQVRRVQLLSARGATPVISHGRT